MANSGGISGTAVAMATAGAFLVYVGIRNVPILTGLREITSGKLPTPRNKPASAAKAALQALYSTGGSTAPGAAGVAPVGTGAAGGLPALVGAAQRYAGDLYSQSRRWDPGYSDCSSFVGKSLSAIGITPPGASITTSYLAWSQLKKIDRSAVGAGDLICNTGHIIIATSNTDGIGQENGRLNVQSGSIDGLMGHQSYVCLRYIGSQAAGSAASMAV